MAAVPSVDAGINFNTHTIGGADIMAAVPSVDAGIIFNTRVHGRQYVERWFAVARVLFLIPVYMVGSTWCGGSQ